jgi:hypothetical protein
MLEYVRQVAEDTALFSIVSDALLLLGTSDQIYSGNMKHKSNI